MNRVPVGASIAHAYEFVFGRFFQIIGTAWVPAALYGVGCYVILSQLHAVNPGHPADPAALAGLFLCWFGLWLGALMLWSVIAVSLTQEALGVRKDLTLAHLVIGPRELRLFFGYLRYVLVYLAYAVLVVGACVALVLIAKTYGGSIAPKFVFAGLSAAVLAAVVVSAILAIWFRLAMLRLFFLLAPVAAAEHRTRLSRAWDLTRGSTFRIFIVYLGTFVPAVIAASVALYYAIGPAEVNALSHAAQGAKPGDPKPVLDFLAGHAGTFAIFYGVMAALSGALLAGASAHAYRVASGHEDPELEDDAALVAPLLAPVSEAEPAPAAPDQGHGGHGHDDHGHGHHEEPAQGHHEEHHDDHGHGSGDDNSHDAGDHGGGDHGHESHGHDDHGHGDHGHDHGHDGHDHDDHAAHGHDDHGHGGHDSHDHAAHDDRGQAGHHHAAPAADAGETHVATEEPGPAQDDHGHGAHDEDSGRAAA